MLDLGLFGDEMFYVIFEFNFLKITSFVFILINLYKLTCIFPYNAFKSSLLKSVTADLVE